MNLTDWEMGALLIGGMIGLGGQLLPFLYTTEGAGKDKQVFIYVVAWATVILAIIFVGCALYDMLAN